MTYYATNLWIASMPSVRLDAATEAEAIAAHDWSALRSTATDLEDDLSVDLREEELPSQALGEAGAVCLQALGHGWDLWEVP